jgi:hypothetical protein
MTIRERATSPSFGKVWAAKLPIVADRDVLMGVSSMVSFLFSIAV